MSLIGIESIIKDNIKQGNTKVIQSFLLSSLHFKKQTNK